MATKKQERSMRDRNHRELVWCLYVGRGLVSNLEHAVAVNAYTMDKADLRAVEQLRKSVAAEVEAFAAYVASKRRR